MQCAQRPNKSKMRKKQIHLIITKIKQKYMYQISIVYCIHCTLSLALGHWSDDVYWATIAFSRESRMLKSFECIVADGSFQHMFMENNISFDLLNSEPKTCEYQIAQFQGNCQAVNGWTAQSNRMNWTKLRARAIARERERENDSKRQSEREWDREKRYTNEETSIKNGFPWDFVHFSACWNVLCA